MGNFGLCCRCVWSVIAWRPRSSPDPPGPPTGFTGSLAELGEVSVHLARTASQRRLCAALAVGFTEGGRPLGVSGAGSGPGGGAGDGEPAVLVPGVQAGP